LVQDVGVEVIVLRVRAKTASLFLRRDVQNAKVRWQEKGRLSPRFLMGLGSFLDRREGLVRNLKSYFGDVFESKSLRISDIAARDAFLIF
jgi:hypothetical protein